MEFSVQGMDFNRAGEAAAQIKKALQLVGMHVDTVRRAVIVAYEAELNIVIHARQGRLAAYIHPDRVEIEAVDEGPGIPDISQAMREGYSTAPDHIRKMGFGAGMGLPNIKKSASHMQLTSEVNVGTRLTAIINNQTSGD
ncbi:ATP-binding protein [Desulfoscipio gibsoniae]|nr:ATP-binding protein [Desulfoscipio gibsoniae]